jgi:hypothetical protein
MTAHPDQHGMTLDGLARALTQTDEPRENLGLAPTTTRTRILAQLDASGDHGCGDGPGDPNSALSAAIREHGPQAVLNAITQATPDGKPAHRRS